MDTVLLIYTKEQYNIKETSHKDKQR